MFYSRNKRIFQCRNINQSKFVNYGAQTTWNFEVDLGLGRVKKAQKLIKNVSIFKKSDLILKMTSEFSYVLMLCQTNCIKGNITKFQFEQTIPKWRRRRWNRSIFSSGIVVACLFATEECQLSSHWEKINLGANQNFLYFVQFKIFSVWDFCTRNASDICSKKTKFLFLNCLWTEVVQCSTIPKQHLKCEKINYLIII